MSHTSRRCGWFVGYVVVIFVGAMTTDRVMAAEPGLTLASRAAREAESRLLAGLHKLVKAEWENVPLEEVLKTLAQAAGANLWIDHESLTAEGISTDDSVVDLHLDEVTVWQVLPFVLDRLALTWHGSEGLLAITTQARANELPVTRTYDVQSIVTALEPQLKKLPPRFRSQSGSGSSGGYCGSGGSSGGGSGGGGNGGAGAPGFFRVPDSTEPTTAFHFVLPQFGGGVPQMTGGYVGARLGISTNSPQTKGEEVLSEMVTQIVHNGTSRSKWEHVDGEGGTIGVGRGRLIVRQDYQTHFQVRQLLQAVEEFVVRGSKTKSMLVARPGYPHEEDAAIFKRLAEPQDINVAEAPLDEALRQLAEAGRYRLWLDKEALTSDGINTDQTVTLKLSGTTLNTVLHRLLEPLTLTFIVEEGALVVTTQVKADEMVSTHICFTGDIPEAHTASDLLTAIEVATSAKWELSDGEGGVQWKGVPEWLVIRQTQACHREIAELFDDLRQAMAAPQEAAAPELELRLYPVADENAIPDLIRSLPDLIPNWDAKHGFVAPLGRSLAIKQPARVHDRLDELFSALDQAHTKLNPPKPEPKPKVEPKPAPVPVAK